MLLPELCLALHELRAPFDASTKYLCYWGRSVAVNAALTSSLDFSECHPETETAASLFLYADNVRNINVQVQIGLREEQTFFGLIGQYSPKITVEDSSIRLNIAGTGMVSKVTLLAPAVGSVRLFGTRVEAETRSGIVEDFFGLFSNTRSASPEIEVDACALSYKLRYYNSTYGVARASGDAFLLNNSNVSAEFTQPNTCTQKGAASGLVFQA